ncbi:hypothetical protein Tco_0966470 [Tanacetum coccineum]
MTQGREVTPPLGFSTLTQLPVTNTDNLPPITAFTFTTRSRHETPPINRASTSADPEPIISPAFIKANFETLDSFMKEYIRHEGVQRELDYSSEDYDEEIEAEPRPSNNERTCPLLSIGYPVVGRPSGRTVGFEGVQERVPSRVERITEERG